MLEHAPRRPPGSRRPLRDRQPTAFLRLAGLLLLVSVHICPAADWPAFRGGPDHAGVTDASLALPLRLAWLVRPAHAPQPAFRGGLSPSKDRVESLTYDYVFEPVVADGRLFFGSSAEDAVFCLDCVTGKTLWRYVTEGPVRFAPRVVGDRLYFGSDDGRVYCLDAECGSLIWRLAAAPSDRRCIGNDRVISAWPVRTSVAVAEDIVYFGSGLFPPHGTYLSAAHAETGELLWRRSIPYSPHGEILIEQDRLMVATGRTAPAEFRRSDGQPLVEDPSPRRARGGSFVAKLNEMLVWGPDESGVIFLRVAPDSIDAPRPRERGTAVGGWITGLRAHSLVARDRLYLVRDQRILAVDWAAVRAAAMENPQVKWRPWEKESYPRYGSKPFGLGRAGQLVPEDRLLVQAIEDAAVWAIPNDDRATAAILAGSRLVLGGRDKVSVLEAASGERRCTVDVEGEARGLAVAGDALFVSTDCGHVYCFREAAPGSTPMHHVTVATPRVRDAKARAVAASILRHTERRLGYCLVLGVDDGSLVAELARQSSFRIAVLDPDGTRIAAVRKELQQAGLYGSRVSVHHVTQPHLDWPAHFANVIVSREILNGDRLPYRPASVLRLLQPYGGVLALRSEEGTSVSAEWQYAELRAWSDTGTEWGDRWAVARRGPLPGAGQWSQMFADPANTVCSGDRLVGSELTLQWFGPPGAEDVVERHAVAMPPLFKDGKMFVAGRTNTVLGVDAYNGTRLWKEQVPGATRMMLSHSAGFMAAGDDVLFVAGDSDCRMLDAGTGKLVHRFPTVNPQRDWGYVGVVGHRLLGSDQKKPADEYSAGSRREGYRFLTNARDLHSRPTVSESLAAHDYQTRKREWTYARDSAILNSTITVDGDRVYFVESRALEVVGDETGTAWLPDFFARDARLVAIGLADGRERWSQPLGPLSTLPGDRHEHMVFLSCANGILLLTRTGHIEQKLGYRLEGRDAATGAVRWQQTIPSRHRVYAPLIYGKNGQQSHPSIVDGQVYLLSHITDALVALDLKTGAIQRDPELFDFWIHSKTCAVPTASASGLYFRRDSCYMLDLPSRRTVDMTTVTRPGCWMSIIPAGGLIMMPEASSACTCGFALQTSVVLAPAMTSDPDSDLERE